MSDRYDAGLLNDFGGGNVDWWQDYIRAEVERANDFHALLHEHSDAVISDRDARIADLEAQNEWLKDRLSDLQLPKNSHIVIDDWLVECGMPARKEGAA